MMKIFKKKEDLKKSFINDIKINANYNNVFNFFNKLKFKRFNIKIFQDYEIINNKSLDRFNLQIIKYNSKCFIVDKDLKYILSDNEIVSFFYIDEILFYIGDDINIYLNITSSRNWIYSNYFEDDSFENGDKLYEFTYNKDIKQYVVDVKYFCEFYDKTYYIVDKEGYYKIVFNDEIEYQTDLKVDDYDSIRYNCTDDLVEFSLISKSDEKLNKSIFINTSDYKHIILNGVSITCEQADDLFLIDNNVYDSSFNLILSDCSYIENKWKNYISVKRSVDEEYRIFDIDKKEFVSDLIEMFTINDDKNYEFETYITFSEQQMNMYKDFKYLKSKILLKELFKDNKIPLHSSESSDYNRTFKVKFIFNKIFIPYTLDYIVFDDFTNIEIKFYEHQNID